MEADRSTGGLQGDEVNKRKGQLRRSREGGGGSAVRMHTCLRRFAALQSCRHYRCSICLDGRTNSQPLGMHERLAVIFQVGFRTANCTPGYAGLRAELDRVTCDAKEVKVCGLSQLELRTQ